MKNAKKLLRFAARLAGIACGLATGLAAFAEDAPRFVNPICEQADPWFSQDGNRYLACFSDGNSAVSIHISERLTVPGVKHIVWIAPATGPASREVWAPELHHIGKHWYVYFAASDGQNQNHKAWVLESRVDNPLSAYTLHGPLYTGDDPGMSVSNRWAIDLTVFELNRQWYAIWSGWADERDVQYLYIAPMKDPVTLAGPRTRICANDDFLWERVDENRNGRGLNEAPEIVEHAGRIFLTYSCSGSWQPSYKMGMLELKLNADPLSPGNWTKLSQPILQASAKTFGIGHASFVQSPDRNEDWIVFHSKINRRDGWQRAVFTQPFFWSAGGRPEFGEPIAAGQPLALPAGERVVPVTSAREFRFKSAADLNGWGYYGHHQLIRVEHGALVLGEMPAQGANEFRSGEKVVVSGGSWTNFEATTRLSMKQPQGQAGILFRVQQPAVGYNAQRGYFAGIMPSEARVVLAATDGFNWRQIASGKLAAPLASETELTVNAQGSEIEVSVDGKAIVQANDSTYLSGSAGLRVGDTSAAFLRLQIKPQPGKVADAHSQSH